MNSRTMRLVATPGTLTWDADTLAPHRLRRPCRRHHHRRWRLADRFPAVTERLTLETADGITLEARWDSADDPAHTTVFCHPHPQMGGSMMAPLMIAVTTKLVERGHRVLRFNFRGTGDSTGQHDEGRAELLDVDAAVAAAREISDEIGIAGWSFGAATALNWLITQEEKIPYVGIAPALQYISGSPPPGQRRIIMGSRDQVIDRDELRSYAIDEGIDLVITPGDHFFHGRGKRIGDLVAEAVVPRV